MLGRVLGGPGFKYVLDAESRLHRAETQRAEGHLEEALREARIGLELLSRPEVRRERTPERLVLVELTVSAEQIAERLNEPGAQRRDVLDSLEFLRRLGGMVQGAPTVAGTSEAERCLEWIPYLEQRLLTIDQRNARD